MTDLTRAALAKELGLTPGRNSQLLTAGTLEGCYQGEGRHRRYDLEKVRAAYLNRTDPGQMLGNGAATVAPIEASRPVPEAGEIGEIGELDALSPDTSAVAIATRSKAISAREQAHRDTRRSAEEEGRYVLASEVGREVAHQISRLAGEVGAEGIYSLGHTFRHGGAQNVLMSLWNVDDAATAEFKEDFYKEWFARREDNPTKPVGQSLQRALRDSRIAAKDAGASQSHWAAFVLTEN